ncbi:MAG: thermopsin, partial [Thaumarchaeota archaeon]|nr:thermopsin [Nitrososphaerota archaeon]
MQRKTRELSFSNKKLTAVALTLLLGSMYLGPALISDARGPRGGSFSPPSPDHSLTISAGLFIPIKIDAYSNSSTIDYTAESNATISAALMDSHQFSVFNNSESDLISNSLSMDNGTNVVRDVRVAAGEYFLVFYNPSQSGTANVTFSYREAPHTPFDDGPRFPPQPTGLASFGIYNDSGNVIPYAIQADGILGVANISAILAHNASAPSLNDSVSGATLQLNSMLVVQEKNAQRVYWIQDTPDFVTDLHLMSFADNLWNVSDIRGALSNQTVTSSNGNYVFQTRSNISAAQDYYGFQTSNFTYFEPLDLRILMNESTLLGTGVLVQLGIQVVGNGSGTTPAPVNWFDNVTIHDPQVQNSFFYTAGNDSTPIGSFYDTELVFCGEGNLESTTFSQLNSTLGLFYHNETSGQVSAFPSYYSFGGDTGEAAYNLNVTYSGNGTARIGVGTPDNVYLNSTQVTTTY